MPFWSLPARVLQQSSLFACGRFRCFPNSHSENILSKMRGKYLPLSILSFSPWQTSWYQDIYFPRSKYQGNIDGAYFGTTFPHLFLITYGYFKPQKGSVTYTPRIFGFKVRSLVPNLQRFFCVLNSSVMQIRELNPDLLPTATRVLSSEALEWSIPDVSYTLHASSNHLSVAFCASNEKPFLSGRWSVTRDWLIVADCSGGPRSVVASKPTHTTLCLFSLAFTRARQAISLHLIYYYLRFVRSKLIWYIRHM